MASKTISAPLIRYVTTKGYSSVAVPAIKETKVQFTKLPTNTVVAALDNGSPVTRVSVAFHAGSRYEAVDDVGISHIIRASAGLTTGMSSGFIIARKLAQIGATISASGDREFLYYTLEATQDQFCDAAEMLNNLISLQEFRPWELNDFAARLHYDCTAVSPQIRAVDLLHKAAYRRGLGNSLFISPKRIGAVSTESVQHYAYSTMTPSRCAVTIVGDTCDKAVMVANALKLPTAGAEIKSEPSCFYGGELRKEMGGDLAHVALAVPGAPAGTPQALAYAIAAKALGCGPVIKWGIDNSPLARAIGNIGPFAAAGFSVSYKDSGLLGVVLSVPKDEANCAVKQVAKALKDPSFIDEKALVAGKNALKIQILSEWDNGTAAAESLAAQLLYTGTAKTPFDLAADIDGISYSDVCTALHAVCGSKMAMGAAGNLSFVPYLDEL